MSPAGAVTANDRHLGAAVTACAPGADHALRDLTSRDDVELLVRNFYARAFADSLLGPIFVDIVQMNLDVHLPPWMTTSPVRRPSWPRPKPPVSPTR